MLLIELNIVFDSLSSLLLVQIPENNNFPWKIDVANFQSDEK